MARKSKGRQRVEMVKMQNENNLQVTFSKRRAGLFKKASELCTLCGVDVVIVVFSPGKKVFSFGHPSVGAVVERFLGRDDEDRLQPVNENGVAPATEQLIEAHRNAMVRELSMELTHMEGMIEVEKKRSEAINQVVEANGVVYGWVRDPYDELNMEQLLSLRNAMEDLAKDVQEKAEHVMVNGFPFNPIDISNPTSRNGLGNVLGGSFRPPGFGYSSTSGVAASSSHHVNGSVTSTSHNVFNPKEASISEETKPSVTFGMDLGFGRQFF